MKGVLSEIKSQPAPPTLEHSQEDGSSHHVVIVGAGIAGLMAAQELLQQQEQHGLQITLLEASDYVGGRIRADKEFCKGHVLDLGAEYVHGLGTQLTKVINHYKPKWDLGDDLLEEQFITAQGDGGPSQHPTKDGKYGMYYVDKELMHYNDPRLSELHDALEEMKDESIQETSVGEFLEQRVSKASLLSLAVAGYANTVGCTDMHQLSLETLAEFERHWDENEIEGDAKLNSKIGMQGVVEALVEELMAFSNFTIELNCPVSRIEQGDGVVTVEAHCKATGNTVLHRADAVIMTVPPPVLLSNDILFQPPLSPRKIKALQLMGMSPCIKLTVKFSERIWPCNVQSVISANATIPEMWFREFKRNTECNEDCYLVCCFLTSDLAIALTSEINATSVQDNEKSRMNRATEIVIDQLSEMFQVSAASLQSVHTGTLLYNWKDHPTIRGGHMYPKVGLTMKHLQDLAKPEKRLVFAGEATHEKACCTVQAAMETGIRAARDVQQVLRKRDDPTVPRTCLPNTVLKKSGGPLCTQDVPAW